MKRIAVVTGASGGIGQAVARRLALDDYTVLGFYRRHREKVLEMDSDSQNPASSIISMQCDLTDPAQVREVFSQIRRFYHHIDLLVCAHGVASIRLFTDTDEQEWNRIIDTNLNGTYRAVYEVLPDMISRKTGNIITIASMWGEVGASCEAAYSASKAGIIGLTKALAKEVGPSGIRVNCVSPGVIRTEMNRELSDETMKELAEETPVGRIGLPEDVADCVSFLASPAASFITGQVLGVSGGFII